MTEHLADTVPAWVLPLLVRIGVWLGIAVAFLALGMSRAPRVEHHYHDTTAAERLAARALEMVE